MRRLFVMKRYFLAILANLPEDTTRHDCEILTSHESTHKVKERIKNESSSISRYIVRLNANSCVLK